MKVDHSKYKEIFLSEARCHIQIMNESLLQLERFPEHTGSFQEIFKSLHTLKSLATTMNYLRSSDLCHVMEDLLDAIRHKNISINQCTDLLFKCFDHLAINIKMLEENRGELDFSHLISQLNTTLGRSEKNVESGLPIIVSTSIDKIQAIEVSVERLDTFMHLAEELLVNKMKLELIQYESENSELKSTIESLGRTITDLQYHIMQIRLVPIGFVFNRFVRMARDLAREQGKEVDLEFEGEDIELDRSLIDEIAESIAHLIKNAIDHGLEKAETRELMNKSKRGTIRFRASRSRDTALIEISDDGIGLDLQAIKNIALDRQLITTDVMPDKIKNLIFLGLSTTKMVTPVSGRGLGLTIVKQKIESIGGNIQVECTPQKGTTFYIEIPLTLAIIRTLFVKVGNDIYAIPLESVERLLIVSPSDLKSLLHYEAIIFEGRDIPVLNLSIVLNKNSTKLDKQPVVVVHQKGKRLGLEVDALLSTQEVIVKPLNRTVKDNKYFTGAALIGSGKIVLILDVAHFLESKIETEDLKQNLYEEYHDAI